MKSRTLTFTSAITLFAALALPAQLAAQHNTSGTNGQIAFTRQITTDAAGIFIANPDGSHEQQVPLGGTDGVEIFSDVHWSPDGRELLIGHTLRIDPSTGQCCLPFRPAIVKPDGSDYKVLTMPYAPFDGGCSVWSLDQTRLLCGFGGDHPGIFSVRSSDGGDPLRLTTYPYGGTDARDVPNDISPDGTRFVFLRYRPGPSHGGPFPFITEQVALFVENIDGTGLRQLTPYGLAFPHEEATAHWSPDGTQIISESHDLRLFVVRIDGTGLTPIKLQTGTQQYFAFEPNWSPDGTRIIFCMFLNGQEEIYTANPDGSDVGPGHEHTDAAGKLH
jgi:Tol biopolymer transport system component